MGQDLGHTVTSNLYFWFNYPTFKESRKKVFFSGPATKREGGKGLATKKTFLFYLFFWGGEVDIFLAILRLKKEEKK